MSQQPSGREYETLLHVSEQGFAGMNARLDRLNGRVRRVEVRAAINTWIIRTTGAIGLVALAAWFTKHL